MIPVFSSFIVWIAIGIGLVAFIGLRFWSRGHSSKDSSLGTVSDQWLAEQRLNRPDSQR